MSEDELIERFFKSSSPQDDVALGIGDDAAVLNLPNGFQLVSGIDTLVEGVHFPEDFSPEHIAQRAIGVNVSDLAAMGAIPKWVSLSISLPEQNVDWLEKFASGFKASCDKYSVHLIGGDTVKGPMVITVTALGIVETGKALRRDGAKAGDRIYVSGSLGGAGFSLNKFKEKEALYPDGWMRFCKPEARVNLGRKLTNLATACMDISDGVLLDAERMAKSSQTGMHIELEKLPLHESLKDLKFQQALEFACFGDDYELLFCVAPEYTFQLEKIATELDLPITRIGEMTAAHNVVLTYNNKPYTVESKGYQHFN